MITKERLEELIKQKAIIYHKLCYGVEPIKAIDYDYEWYGLNDIFETKEEAELYLEFGDIQKIERLSLPSFEEFCREKSFNFSYYSKFNCFNYCKIKLVEENIEIEIIYNITTFTPDYVKGENVFKKECNMENYIEACRLAKKLFLGE